MSRHGGQLVYIPWPDEEEEGFAGLADTRKLLPRGSVGSPSAAAPAPPAPPPPATAPAPPLFSATGWSAYLPLAAARPYLIAAGVLLVVLYLLSAGEGAPPPAAAVQPAAPLSPMSALPGMGPGGPVVGAWGLEDVVLPRSLTFLSIGDWGRDGKGGQEVTAPVLEAWAAATRAAFVVSVGDNVYVDGVPPGTSAAEADAVLKRFFSNVYSTPYLAKLPFHVILGNHDYRGDIRAQLEWRGDPRWNVGLNFERSWELPPRRAGGKPPCLSAVFTDTTPLIGYYRTPEQREKHPTLGANAAAADRAGTLAWTAAAVAAAAAACDATFVFGHHPLYSPGEHSNSKEMISAYGALLEREGVDAYVAGHDHILAHSRAAGGGVEHVLTGAGSEVRPALVPGAETQWVATRRGFTVHSVNATHQAVAYVWADKEAGATQAGLPGRVAFRVVKPLRGKPHRGAA